VDWRVHRSRWLLTTSDPEGHASEVEALLGDVNPTSTTLRKRALAQRQSGNKIKAADMLQEAIFLSPDDFEAIIDLAQLWLDMGEEQDALDLVQSAVSQPELIDSQIRSAAGLYLALQRPDRAATMLERLNRNGRATPNDRLTLARLYQQTQQTNAALGLIETLMASPDIGTLVLAADIYATAGQTEAAREALDQLETAGASPGVAANLRAAYLVKHGDPQEAEAAFVAATRAAPDSGEAWNRLIGFQLRNRQAADAIASARLGLRTRPDDKGLLSLVGNAGPIERMAEDAGAASFALTLLLDPVNRRTAADVLNLLDRRAQQPNRAKLADELQVIADANPRFETLQVVTVTAQLAAGRYQAALDRATALTQTYPESARAARLTAEAWASIGRWRQALLAAERWAEIQNDDRADADTLIARAQRLLDQGSQAVATLSPYRGQIERQPMLRPEMTKQWALALATQGQSREARDLLEPRLSEGLPWRMAMLDAAVLNVPATRQAGQWLESVEAAIPEDSWAERSALAQAWWTLGRRDSFTPYLERGRQQAATLVGTPAETAELWYFLGTIGEADGDLGAAEKAYRRAIALNPDTLFASNNLAMVLAEYGGDLNEAVGLAQRVVDARPEDPNFHDTLAFVLLQAGRHDEAEQAIRAAMELDPSNPMWRIRLDEINTSRAPGSSAEAQ
jgi:tetratricopeptide (TPR) repeat protein